MGFPLSSSVLVCASLSDMAAAVWLTVGKLNDDVCSQARQTTALRVWDGNQSAGTGSGSPRALYATLRPAWSRSLSSFVAMPSVPLRGMGSCVLLEDIPCFPVTPSEYVVLITYIASSRGGKRPTDKAKTAIRLGSLSRRSTCGSLTAATQSLSRLGKLTHPDAPVYSRPQVRQGYSSLWHQTCWSSPASITVFKQRRNPPLRCCHRESSVAS